MLQALLVRFLLTKVLDMLVDALLEAAKEKVSETDNTLDDAFVKQIEDNKEAIKSGIRDKVKK